MLLLRTVALSCNTKSADTTSPSSRETTAGVAAVSVSLERGPTAGIAAALGAFTGGDASVQKTERGEGSHTMPDKSATHQEGAKRAFRKCHRHQKESVLT